MEKDIVLTEKYPSYLKDFNRLDALGHFTFLKIG